MNDRVSDRIPKQGIVPEKDLLRLLDYAYDAIDSGLHFVVNPHKFARLAEEVKRARSLLSQAVEFDCGDGVCTIHRCIGGWHLQRWLMGEFERWHQKMGWVIGLGTTFPTHEAALAEWEEKIKGK